MAFQCQRAGRLPSCPSGLSDDCHTLCSHFVTLLRGSCLPCVYSHICTWVPATSGNDPHWTPSRIRTGPIGCSRARAGLGLHTSRGPELSSRWSRLDRGPWLRPSGLRSLFVAQHFLVGSVDHGVIPWIKFSPGIALPRRLQVFTSLFHPQKKTKSGVRICPLPQQVRFPGAGVRQASWGARRGGDEERLPLSLGSMGPGCLRNSGELGAQPAALGTAPQPTPCAKYPSKCRLSIAEELYVPLLVIVSKARLFQLRCIPKPEATKGGGQKSRAGQGWGFTRELGPSGTSQGCDAQRC